MVSPRLHPVSYQGPGMWKSLYKPLNYSWENPDFPYRSRAKSYYLWIQGMWSSCGWQKSVRCSFCPTLLHTRGTGSAWGFFGSLLNLNTWGLCAVWSYGGGGEFWDAIPKGKDPALWISSNSMIVPFFLVTLAPRWQGTNLIHLYTSTSPLKMLESSAFELSLLKVRHAH